MSSGIVKWFNPTMGYGYIMGFDGSDIYFHNTSIIDRQHPLNWPSGTKVEFDLIQTTIGFEATNIRLSALAW
ncbi:MAG: cold shock domain-containing protein [Bdellovibrionales bacterium]|nr:cold shock domain-containing protein [Bdellovibrionales bacterium]